MRLVKPNWYSFDHAAVTKKFEGNPQFCNDFCVKGEYQPSAVYYSKKPNKRKKHKTYMLLTKSDGQFYIRGMSPREMNKYRYQSALYCLSCKDIIYSVMRHDFRSCTCGKVSVDGGKDYFKISYKPRARWKQVTVDLLTDLISDPITK